tara:strand:+ start:1034 stop:1354 length:321 start_codon:yes stop_codon:yes gene_type:complete
LKLSFPRKSLFGFRILGAWQSTIAAYLMLLPLYLLPPLFGAKPLEIQAGFLFLIVLNLSIIILTLNSIQQKSKTSIYLWVLINFPLWCLLPFEVRLLYYSFKELVF